MDISPSFSREEWLEKIELIDKHLQNSGSSAVLCIIGSAAGILAGQPARTSIDIDVLVRKSRFVMSELRKAVEAAGMDFDPKGEVTRPYVQLVYEGIVQVGEFSETRPIVSEKMLSLVAPPPENLIASKLLRASPKDIEDVAYLLAAHRTSAKAVAQVIKTFPPDARKRAAENLVYIEVLAPQREGPPDRLSRDESVGDEVKKKRRKKIKLDFQGARSAEIDAVYLILNYQEFVKVVAAKEWARLLNVMRLVKQDVSPELALTDPALFKTLRDAITRLYVQGWVPRSVRKLEKLVGENARLEETMN